jgi:hypothetical protein
MDPDPNLVIVVAAAVKAAVSKFTYMGINVGSYVTDDECSQVAIAAIKAAAAYQNGKTI